MKTKEEDELFITEKFTWRIKNFSKLKNERHYSDVFIIGGLKWRILVNPKLKDVRLGEHLAMYLGVADASTLPPGWTRSAHFSLSVVNQLDSKKSITKPAKGTSRQVFNENASEWGYKLFMPGSELHDYNAGYLLNDVCVVEAKIDVPFNIEDQGIDVCTTLKTKQLMVVQPSKNSVKAPNCSADPKTPCSVLVPTFQDAPSSQKVLSNSTNDNRGKPSLVKELVEVPTDPTGEVLDLRGLNIEKAFIPLLEEACLWHPSLIALVRKRSPKFTECAFTALGQVPHFLKTTKVMDMNEDVCARFQLLWEELETFKFNLAWLEPYVQSAFGLKKFVEMAERVKRLRENVDELESKLKTRRTTLMAAEVDLEIARIYLPKIDKIDMNSELGYGRS